MALVWVCAAASAQSSQHRPSASEDQGGRRVALVIGNADYRGVPALTNALANAHAVTAALRKNGFEVWTALDLDRARMESTLRSFEAQIAGAAVAVFYFAGYGIDVSGDYHLMTINVPNPAKGVARDWVRLHTVQLMMERARASVLLLETRHEETLARQLVRHTSTATMSDPVGMALAPGYNMLIGLASPVDASAGLPGRDGADPSSPFTDALVRRLGQPDVEVRTLMHNITADVAAATGGRQRPWFADTLPDAVVLGPTTGASDPGQRAGELAQWEQVMRNGSSADLQAYLRSYPQGAFSAAARALLESDMKGRQAPGQPAGDRFARIESFEWPPPRFSAYVEIPRGLIIGDERGATLGKAVDRLRTALLQAGHEQHSFLRINDNGLAVVTHVERLSEDGTPIAGSARFRPPHAQEPFSLLGFVRSLIATEPGHYRLIAFAITADELPAAGSGRELTSAEATALPRRGLATLPKTLGELPFTLDHRVLALIYEFEKDRPDATAVLLDPGRFTAMQHLQKAAIWPALQGLATPGAARARP